MTLADAVVTGISGGLTLGISQFIANEYVGPALKKFKVKHDEALDKFKQELKVGGGLK